MIVGKLKTSAFRKAARRHCAELQHVLHLSKDSLWPNIAMKYSVSASGSNAGGQVENRLRQVALDPGAHWQRDEPVRLGNIGPGPARGTPWQVERVGHPAVGPDWVAMILISQVGEDAGDALCAHLRPGGWEIRMLIVEYPEVLWRGGRVDKDKSAALHRGGQDELPRRIRAWNINLAW